MTKDSPLTVAGAAAALGKFPRTAFPFDPPRREPSCLVRTMSRFRVNQAAFTPALCPGLCQKSNAGRFLHRGVMAGLDPAIHLSSKDSCEDGWIRGSSPRMTQS